MMHLGPSLRRTKVQERPWVPAALALLASLALNALLMLLLVRSGAFDVGRMPQASQVALAPLSAQQWEKNRSIVPPPRERDPAGEVVELPPEQQGQQQQADDRPPPKTRFLSDRDSRTEKETFSRHAGDYPNLAPRPQLPSAPRTGAGEAGRARRSVKGPEGAPGPKSSVPAPNVREGIAVAPGGGQGRRAEGKRAPDLTVGPESLARALAGPNMHGYGKGLEEDETTSLNTRDFKYATFINRMGQSIGDLWRPRMRDAVEDRDPDGSMFFYRDRTVVLGLTMDLSGRVTDLSILQSSNIDFFDRVAEAAVRSAQPFPNPPPGMFSPDGTARVEFSFTALAARRPAIRWRMPYEK
jgi:TonB family protein